MSQSKTFENFAADFELCVDDDNWRRLARYFTADATYQNLDSPDPKCRGREAILAFFKADVTNTDRKFDSRKLTALADPVVDHTRLSRQWQCTYTLGGAPDLVLTGESRYQFDGELIKALETELSHDSLRNLEHWMAENGGKLPV